MISLAMENAEHGVLIAAINWFKIEDDNALSQMALVRLHEELTKLMHQQTKETADE